MTTCALDYALSLHEAEEDRRAACDDFCERIVVTHEKALATRLLRCKGWVSELIGEGGDPLADLVQAINAAIDFRDFEAGAMLRRAFLPATGEKARELLSEAAKEFAQANYNPRARGYSYDNPPPEAPDADSIDLSDYE